MDMYVVGVYKKGKNIAGFKILAINSDNSVEVRDVSYADTLGVVKSGKATIKNLRIDNGELKGVNGSLDRYGIVGKSQSLVVLKELQDNSGKTQGYLCSDSLGQTRNLTEQQVIMFAEKFAIANGKIVPGENGTKHVSAIEGAYDIKKPIQKQQSKPTQIQQQPIQNNNVQGVTNKPALPNDVIDLINKVKARPEYAGSFAESVIKSVEESGKCSYRQKNALEKTYDGWLNPNKNSVTPEVKSLIDEAKQYSKYKGSFAENLVNFIEKNNRCSEKQLESLKKECKRLKEEDEKLAKERAQQAAKQQQTQPAQQQTPVQQPTTAQTTPSTSSTSVSKPVNNNTSKKIAQIDKDNERESRKRDDDSKKEKIEIARKSMDAKQRRALTQNISSNGLFDYSFTKDGRAYVEGFSKDVEVPEDLVIPETVVKDGKTYKVTGITIGAFQTEPIVTVTTSKYINDIGQGAFRFCEKLKRADLSQSTHALIPARLFAGCENLEEVLPGNYVQRVHEYAFLNCKKLKRIAFSDVCTTFARSAFEWCKELESCISNVKTIDFGVFYNCSLLKEFNFSSVLSIGPQAFRRTGFNEIVLPGNVRVAGEKAFADCYALQKVTIEEGVEELGAFCFAKSEFDSYELGNLEAGKVKLDELYAPKSLKLVGADAFRNVGLVIGWTGSVAESKCISFNTPFKRLDNINTDNSTSTRVKANILNLNPILTLRDKIDAPVEGKSNPEFIMEQKKLVDIPFTKAQLDFFKMTESTGEKEPHILFKAAVNYLQDMSDFLQAPLSNGVLRLQNTFYVINTPIYDDGCNKISKITYQIMDTLDDGSFIVVFMNNHLRYMTDCNMYTNINIDKTLSTDDNIPIVTYLHSGDIIGEQSTISGHDGIIKEAVGKGDNVGKRFYNMIRRNSIVVSTTKKASYLYVPCEGVYLSLHDKRADNLEGEEKIEVECQSVLEIDEYKKLVSELKKIKKNLGGSEKFFDNLSNLSASYVARRIKDINTIEDEKEAQLFLVSKKFNEIVDSAGIAPNPNLLTYELFNELSHSYWMISKDEDWLQQTGKKSLNRTAEYHIGKYKLTEYKSNQIVKFSNPYMNGCKGAYVFTLTSGNTLLGVYASRYSMHYITDKLYDLTNIKKGVEIPDAILTSAERFDKLPSNLFYQFYNVLYSKGGWSFKEYSQYSYSSQNVGFNISMYKPTGVFYLTMTRLVLDTTSKDKRLIGVKTMPILPIGNMDRALMVAETTNKNAKNTKLYDELMELAAYHDYNDNILRIRSQELKDSINNTYDKYVAARRLIIAGVKDVAQYKALIDDRAVYMLGTVHQGVLQREHASIDYDSEVDDFSIDMTEPIEDIDTSDLDFDSDISDDNDIDIDLDDEEADLEDEEFDLDDDEEEPGMSFEEFFETAKSMGITDEGQARIMYMNFINNQ